MTGAARGERPSALQVDVPASWGVPHWVIGDDATAEGRCLNVVAMRRRDVERIAKIVPGSAPSCPCVALVPPLSDAQGFWISPWEIRVGHSVIEMSLNLPRHLLQAPLASYPTVDTAARTTSPSGMEDELAQRIRTRRRPWSSPALVETLRDLAAVRGRVRWYSDTQDVDQIDHFGSGSDLVHLLTRRDDPHTISGLVDRDRMPFYLW